MKRDTCTKFNVKLGKALFFLLKLKHYAGIWTFLFYLVLHFYNVR